MIKNTRQGNKKINSKPHVKSSNKMLVFLSMVSIESLAGACGFFIWRTL